MSFRANALLAATCAVGVSLLLAACGGSAPKATAAQEDEAKFVKFAKCMREHGINIHASASGGKVSVGIQGAPGAGGPNPESPAFQAAQKACQGLLPFKGGGPGPATSKVGPGGTGSGASLSLGG
jgi:hypothetical protein